MPTVFRTYDKGGKPHPRWRIKYRTFDGKRKTVTGLTSKEETVKLAWRLENKEEEIRKGIRQPPTPSDQPRLFSDAVQEYLAWGECQGGRFGLPWAKGYAKDRKRKLKFMQERLDLEFVSDMDGILAETEKVMRELIRAGRLPISAWRTVSVLAAFCTWLVERDYLPKHPLKRLKKPRSIPRLVRRPLTQEEIEKLLAASAPERRLVYELALSTGLRGGELRRLKAKNLEANGDLRLQAAITKERKEAVFHLHPVLNAKLAERAALLDPEDRLLRVPVSNNKSFRRDLERAGIPQISRTGRANFHGLRVTYATLLIESGATVKEVQTLMRHSDPTLTMNIYAKVRAERINVISVAVGDRIMGSAGNGHGGCPTDVQRADAAHFGVQVSHDADKGSAGLTPNAPEYPEYSEPLAQDRTPAGQDQAQTGPHQEVTPAFITLDRTGSGLGSDASGRSPSPTEVQRRLIAISIYSSVFCIPQPVLAAAAEVRGVSGFSGFSAGTSAPVPSGNGLGVVGFSGASGFAA
ncbi:MAG: site-specific integrase [Planctomycetes bacterium]|nr:site-specific integrase [Planctomycetota bacterium]